MILSKKAETERFAQQNGFLALNRFDFSTKTEKSAEPNL